MSFAPKHSPERLKEFLQVMQAGFPSRKAQVEELELVLCDMLMAFSEDPEDLNEMLANWHDPIELPGIEEIRRAVWEQASETFARSAQATFPEECND
jgi:hypothetical protein